MNIEQALVIWRGNRPRLIFAAGTGVLGCFASPAVGLLTSISVLQLFSTFDIYQKISKPKWFSVPVSTEPDQNIVNYDAVCKLLQTRTESAASIWRILIVLALNVFLIYLLELRWYAASLPGTLVLSWIIYNFTPLDQKRTRRPGIVFRRFGKIPKEDGVCYVISRACAGLANPVTIQDQSYIGEQSIEWFGKWYGLALINILAVAMLIVSSWLSAIASLTFIVLWTRLAHTLSSRQETIPASRYLRAVQKILERIESGSIRYNGLETLRFADDCWRDAVITMLKRSQFAIIDITALLQRRSTENANVEWEILTALKNIPTSQIIFLVECLSEGTPKVDLKQRCLSVLTAAGFESQAADLQDAHYVEFLIVKDLTELVSSTGRAVDCYREITHATAQCIASHERRRLQARPQ